MPDPKTEALNRSRETSEPQYLGYRPFDSTNDSLGDWKGFTPGYGQATMRAVSDVDPDVVWTMQHGRLSSSGTLWGSGGNLQNQPHAAYPMFVCDDGYMLSYFDLKQAEAKVVAYLWNVEGLIENFERAEVEEGFDVHRGNAARIFRLPYNEIPESDYDDDGKRSLRYLGKRCVHGLNYRMQAPKLATVCGLSLIHI